MTEAVKYRRVIFKKGRQSYFLEGIRIKLGFSYDKIASIIGISPRTLADWRKERFLMTDGALFKLCRIAEYDVPKRVRYLNQFWYTKMGGLAGGPVILRKYGHIGGNPQYRKKKWHEWWDNQGKFNSIPILSPLPFRKPVMSNKLAEFMGIMMGDGGMSKNQIHITLNRIDDEEYCHHVVRTMEDLFKVKSSIYSMPKRSVNVITISRIGLVKYLNTLGLKIGNKIKQGLDIPAWIKRNSEYQISCLRGLVDTDGSVIIHRYKVNGKAYIYMKIDFTSRSPALLKSVADILRKLAIKYRVMRECQIRIEAQVDVKKYFVMVGSHNQKHINRYLG